MHPSRLFLCVAASLLLGSSGALAAPPEPASTNPLVTVDRHRLSIISDIVEGFRDQTVRAAGPLAEAELARLHSRLSSLRADKLLAASLASTYASLQVILHEAEMPSRLPKALGDSTNSLVYTPLKPCRYLDTRGFGAPISGGPFQPGERRQYAPQGVCGLPSSGIYALMVSFTTQNYTPRSGGTLRIFNASEPNPFALGTSDIFNTDSVWSASNTVVSTGAGGEFAVFVEHATAEVIVDFLGWFGIAGFSATQLLPTTACQADQIPKWTTAGGASKWECARDELGVTGVTAVNAGPGLGAAVSGSTATVNLAGSQLLPTTQCATNQVTKWNGSAWVCANDLIGGGGGVTSITAGSGLDGGTITSQGTISVRTGGIATTHLADSAVTEAKIAVGSINNAMLLEGALPEVEWFDTAEAEIVLGAGSGTVTSAACPPSMFVVSGACIRAGAFTYLEEFGAVGDAWACRYRNTGESVVTIRARARCMAPPAAAK